MSENNPTRDDPWVVGDEELDPDALSRATGMLQNDEELIALAGFDFETKVVAITNQRILITERGSMSASTYRYPDTSAVTRDGRTLVLARNTGGIHRYRMGNDGTVEELVQLAHRQLELWRGGDKGHFDNPSNPTTSGASPTQDQAPSIAERVRFWEEQDRLNQELIPRVIRQNELLTGHIADHENLPLAAAEAARQAISQAQETIDKHLEEARRERDEQAQQLEQARAEREEQGRLMEQAKAERDVFEGDYQAALAEANAQRRRTTLLSVGVSAVCAAIALAAVVMAILG